MANHKLSIDTTQDPCVFSLDSTFFIFLINSVADPGGFVLDPDKTFQIGSGSGFRQLYINFVTTFYTFRIMSYAPFLNMVDHIYISLYIQIRERSTVKIKCLSSGIRLINQSLSSLLFGVIILLYAKLSYTIYRNLVFCKKKSAKKRW
jgi:hypothetical protein